MQIPAGWTLVTKYAIRRGEWTISGHSLSGEWRYCLWRAGESQGMFYSAQAATEAAERAWA